MVCPLVSQSSTKIRARRLIKNLLTYNFHAIGSHIEHRQLEDRFPSCSQIVKERSPIVAAYLSRRQQSRPGRLCPDRRRWEAAELLSGCDGLRIYPPRFPGCPVDRSAE